MLRVALSRQLRLASKISTQIYPLLSKYPLRYNATNSSSVSSSKSYELPRYLSPIHTVPRGLHRVKKIYEVGQVVEGFEVIAVKKHESSEISSIRLKDRATGASWLHLDCDDNVNTFCVSFPTFPTDDSGVAHVLEHTVLCGSKKYPVRDPFFNMLRRSLQTFMNAMTSIDCTFYPFATANADDYVNLTSVYLDSTFNPLLNKFDFLQEGVRIEDKDSEYHIKGVVYNEMKGAYSDGSALMSRALQSLHSGSYRCDSGGDPLAIPSLTVEKLRSFHDKHYNASNAKFYTYGDLPLEYSLALARKVLDTKGTSLKVEEPFPVEIPWTAPRSMKVTCNPEPLSGDDQNRYSISWRLFNLSVVEQMAMKICSQLLIESPTSPLYEALVNSGLGVWSESGFDGFSPRHAFTLGLSGVSKENSLKLEEIVLKVLDEIVNKQVGLEIDRVESAINSMELSAKHIGSNHGMNLLYKILPFWNTSESDPTVPLEIDYFISELRTQCLNPKYLSDLLSKHLLYNPHRLSVHMSPDENWSNNQNEKEKSILKEIVTNLNSSDKERIKSETTLLEAHQNSPQNPELLPTLHPSSIPRSVSDVLLNSVDVGFPLLIVPQATNGIVYLHSSTDIRSLIPAKAPLNEEIHPDKSWEKFDLIPLYSSLVSRLSTKKYSTSDLSNLITKFTGGIYSSAVISRHGIQIDTKSNCLERNVDKMVDLCHEVITSTVFTDLNRLSALVSESQSAVTSSLVESGHLFAISYASAVYSTENAIRDRWSGLHQAMIISNWKDSITNSKNKLAELAGILSTFSSDFKPLFISETKTMVTAPSKISIGTISKQIAPLITGASKGKVQGSLSVEPFKHREHSSTFIGFDIPIHHVAMSFSTVKLGHPDAPKLAVLARILTDYFLHKEIREVGGAYGGGCNQSISKGTFEFYSYRDPNCERTVSTFQRSLSWIQTAQLGERHLNEALLSIFSSLDKPKAPSDVGASRFKGIAHEEEEIYRQQLLSVKLEDVIAMSCKYFSGNPSVCAVGPKETGSSLKGWNIINLNL